MSKEKILITGGHLTPALAFMDFCQARRAEVEVIFAGREYAQEDNGQLSWEEKEVAARGVKFIAFAAVKSGAWNVMSLGQSVIQARQIMQEEKVARVLSFGGYMAIPFALAAKQMKIPVITHEQTQVLGRANRLLSPLVDKIAVSFPATRTLFPRKTVVTGNPLREELWDRRAPRPSWLPKMAKPMPILYVAGGSQGSRTLNENLLPIVDQLVSDYVIVHQTGRASAKYDPEQEIAAYLRQRKWQLASYVRREFLTGEELAYLLPRLEIAVSRAGANTVAELSAFAVATLYIPLPRTHYREQELNAQAMVDQGAAMMLPQAELLPQRLMEMIDQLQQQKQQLVAQLKKIPVERLANERIWELLAIKGKINRAPSRLE
jgi:UDP-N-acetylglucosamine--N-acetylmuramyl-(pentapeptide) pyrophosphoryl-undecaprenol N-acetylglucosamine transferase